MNAFGAYIGFHFAKLQVRIQPPTTWSPSPTSSTKFSKFQSNMLQIMTKRLSMAPTRSVVQPFQVVLSYATRTSRACPCTLMSGQCQLQIVVRHLTCPNTSNYRTSRVFYSNKSTKLTLFWLRQALISVSSLRCLSRSTATRQCCWHASTSAIGPRTSPSSIVSGVGPSLGYAATRLGVKSPMLGTISRKTGIL